MYSLVGQEPAKNKKVSIYIRVRNIQKHSKHSWTMETSKVSNFRILPNQRSSKARGGNTYSQYCGRSAAISPLTLSGNAKRFRITLHNTRQHRTPLSLSLSLSLSLTDEDRGTVAQVHKAEDELLHDAVG